MSLVKDSQDLIEIGELAGREVIVALFDGDNEVGILHSLSSHGLLVKNEKDGRYVMFPWKNVKWIEHDTGEKKEKPIDEQEKPEWADIDKDRVERLIMADGINKMLEDAGFIVDVDKDLNINISYDGTDVFDIVGDKITVYEQEDIENGKAIATKFKLKIAREYEE